jgi:pimeloyl-ACP methyl ester carboxylesterase
MPYLRLQEGDIYYQRLGQGPPLVFVNDWVLSHTYWEPVLRLLSPSYSCITYDPRGVGRSAYFDPGASYAVEAHAEDLHQLIVSLRSGYVHLVGHGLGGVIAGLCLKAHPQDVRTLTLIATDSADNPPLYDKIKHAQSLIILRRLAAVPLVRSLVLRRYSLGRLPDDPRKEIVADFGQMNPQAAWETMITALEEQTLSQFLTGVTTATVPILLVACGQDKVSSSEGMRALFNKIDRGRLVTMHASGHFPMLEFPEKFVQILQDFYSAVAG